MDIGVVGDGPAAEAVEAALGDVEVNAFSVDPAVLDGFDLAVVVDTPGSPAFAAANERLDRWVAVEVGGVGGVALTDVDAAVTVFEAACYDCLCTRGGVHGVRRRHRRAGGDGVSWRAAHRTRVGHR